MKTRSYKPLFPLKETAVQYGTDYASFHIDNGGVSFSIGKTVFDGGDEVPLLKIQGSHFGNLTNSIELMTSPEAIKKLGQFLIDHADDFQVKGDPYMVLDCEVVEQKALSN